MIRFVRAGAAHSACEGAKAGGRQPQQAGQQWWSQQAGQQWRSQQTGQPGRRLPRGGEDIFKIRG